MTPARNDKVWTPKAIALTAGLLAGWAALAYWIGSTGALYTNAATPIRPIALSAIVPVTIFFLAYGISERFRAFVLAQDIRVLTTLQLWRVVGFGFLMLYAFDVLPGLFAWPAGVGDVFVGIAAAFLVARLAADPAFARTRRFVAFHIAGLTDFAVAIVAAALSAGAYPALIPGGVTSAPMELWPLNLFPSVIVPIFIILHASVFLKLRAEARAAHRTAADTASLQTA